MIFMIFSSHSDVAYTNLLQRENFSAGSNSHLYIFARSLFNNFVTAYSTAFYAQDSELIIFYVYCFFLVLN